MYSERKVMYTSLFDTFFSDSLIAPARTVYVVSDSQLEELKRNQRQEELDNIEDSRKRLEDSYQARIKVLDERQNELKEELKALSPTKPKAALNKKQLIVCLKNISLSPSLKSGGVFLDFLLNQFF